MSQHVHITEWLFNDWQSPNWSHNWTSERLAQMLSISGLLLLKCTIYLYTDSLRCRLILDKIVCPLPVNNDKCHFHKSLHLVSRFYYFPLKQLKSNFTWVQGHSCCFNVPLECMVKFRFSFNFVTFHLSAFLRTVQMSLWRALWDSNLRHWHMFRPWLMNYDILKFQTWQNKSSIMFTLNFGLTRLLTHHVLDLILENVI